VKTARESKSIALLFNDVLGIFVEIGKDYMDLYRNEIEVPMLEYTVDYYSQKTASWSFEENSCNGLSIEGWRMYET
jgi:hypothetical protein